MAERVKDVLWLDQTTQSLNLDECQEWRANQADPCSDGIYLSPENRWVLDAGGATFELPPERAGILLVSWKWHLPSALIRALQDAESAEHSLSPATPLPLVVLGKRSDEPLFRGIRKERLTEAQYDVVDTLLTAGEDGLSKDALVRKSKRGDARGVLRRLDKSDRDWDSVILMAGKSYRKYRILC